MTLFPSFNARTPARIGAGVWSLRILAAALCLLAACSKAEKPIEPVERTAPPADVPIYDIQSVESRDVGEGGYRIVYSSQSNIEAVTDFVEREWPKAGWIKITEVVESDARSLHYYRKDNRLLMLILESNGDVMGCRFTVMETVGESPRGNVLSRPEEEPMPAQAEAGEH